MKQKLALCCALVHAPKVLFLDEPTTGVDPVSRREFWEMLAYLRQEGITLVVSTPFMDEALRCDRVAFLYEGEIKGIDRPEAILKQFSEILCPPGLQRKAVDKHTPPLSRWTTSSNGSARSRLSTTFHFLYNGEKSSAS
jgi:ABC-type multidrug transport system ATPase subunit